MATTLEDPMSETERAPMSDTERDTARDGSRGQRFTRGTHDPNHLVSVKVPSWMRDKIDEERQRIEPNAAQRRSLETFYAWVFQKGLEALQNVQPVTDPLA